MLAHAIIKVLVYGERIIVVLGSIHPIFGYVQVHAVIPRFWNTHSVVFQRLIIQPKQSTGTADKMAAKVPTLRPRSSSVRSSTLPAMTFHRQSTSEMYPRHSGLAAVRANYIQAESERRLKINYGVGVEDRTYHYGSDGDKGVIHSARILNTTTLEGQLKAATAHAKAHRVHVNVVDESGTMPRL